jgi:hypothetical protein
MDLTCEPPWLSVFAEPTIIPHGGEIDINLFQPRDGRKSS